MPCRCDYMEPQALEIETSRVACLLAETEGKKWTKDQWAGYHPKVYSNCTQDLADELTRTLCTFLKKNGSAGYSLEMQMWWRDHLQKDKQRAADERQRLKRNKDKAKALAKLTQKEKQLLRLT